MGVPKSKIPISLRNCNVICLPHNPGVSTLCFLKVLHNFVWKLFMLGEDTPLHVTEQSAKAHHVSQTHYGCVKMWIPSALRVAQRAWGSQVPQANHCQPCSPDAIAFYVCQSMNKAGRHDPGSST